LLWWSEICLSGRDEGGSREKIPSPTCRRHEVWVGQDPFPHLPKPPTPTLGWSALGKFRGRSATGASAFEKLWQYLPIICMWSRPDQPCLSALCPVCTAVAFPMVETVESTGPEASAKYQLAKLQSFIQDIFGGKHEAKHVPKSTCKSDAVSQDPGRLVVHRRIMAFMRAQTRHLLQRLQGAVAPFGEGSMASSLAPSAQLSRRQSNLAITDGQQAGVAPLKCLLCIVATISCITCWRQPDGSPPLCNAAGFLPPHLWPQPGTFQQQMAAGVLGMSQFQQRPRPAAAPPCGGSLLWAPGGMQSLQPAIATAMPSLTVEGGVTACALECVRAVSKAPHVLHLILFILCHAAASLANAHGPCRAPLSLLSPSFWMLSAWPPGTAGSRAGCSGDAAAHVQQLAAADLGVLRDDDGGADGAEEAPGGVPSGGTMELVKRSYNPSVIIRKRRHGFLARLRTKGGRRVLERRMQRGRWKKTA